MDKAKCEFCGRGIPDPSAHGIHQFVSGWVMNRAGGGAHGIRLPRAEPRFAHRECVDDKARGRFGTASLFDE